MFVPNQSGKILPRALYGAALAAEYGLGVRGASSAAAGALGGHGGAAGGQSFGQVMTGAIPGAGILGAMKTDAESGHPLRTKLRGMLGLEDPGEPAPWQAGGQWRQSDSDSPDVVATRANTDAVGESTEQQFSLVEQLTDLNNSLRRLLGLGGAGAGGGGAQIMQASLAAAAASAANLGRARRLGRRSGHGRRRRRRKARWGVDQRRRRNSRRRRRDRRMAAPAAPAAPAITGGETAGGGGGGRGEAAYARAGAAGGGRGGGGRGDLYAQRAPMIMADLKRELGLTHEQAAGLVGNLGYESAGFKALQEGRPISGAGGFGYAQWTGPRRRKFMQYAQQRGLDPKSHEANVGFLKHELTGEHAGFLRRLKQTKTLQEATRLTHEVYETPADVQPKYWGQYKPYASAPGRLQYAKRAHAMGGGQTAVASAEPAMAAPRSGSDAVRRRAAAAPEPL